MQAKSYHVFAAKSDDNRDFATFAEAERYSRLFEIVSELIDWPSHKCVLQTISHDAKRRNSFDTAPFSWSELLARASDGVLHVLETDGPYEVVVCPLGGKLLIRRRDPDACRTVATVEHPEHWVRFIAAVEAGLDEVAAVHAIDEG
jgi:hypothetical protein